MTHICVPAYMYDTGDSNEIPTPRIEKEIRIKYTEICTIKTFSYQSQRRQMRATNLKDAFSMCSSLRKIKLNFSFLCKFQCLMNKTFLNAISSAFELHVTFLLLLSREW